MTTNNVTRIYPTVRVESVDEALPAALRWADENLDERGGFDCLAAFVAGARYERERRQREQEAES